MSYLAEQRTQGIGIRVAIGASPSQVLWLVTNQGLRAAIAGLAPAPRATSPGCARSETLFDQPSACRPVVRGVSHGSAHSAGYGSWPDPGGLPGSQCDSRPSRRAYRPVAGFAPQRQSRTATK